MCTLSLYRDAGGCILTMNRDEHRQRHESGELRSLRQGDTRICFPVDPRSGGTWLGINSQGVCLCLTNRYQDSIVPAGGRSRGLIIPDALMAGDEARVRAHLLELAFHEFAPFDLFLTVRAGVTRFSWNGHDVAVTAVTEQPWYLHCSSALDGDAVVHFREQQFADFLERSGQEEDILAERVMRDFHDRQVADSPDHSVLMDRANSHTKSITQVRLDSRRTVLEYRPRKDDGTLDVVRRIEWARA